MRFSIRHRTRHRYPAPVFLEPHTLRFHPRGDPAQRVRRCAVTVLPPPAGLDHGLDAEGNPTTWVWFEGLTRELLVDVRLEVDTLRDNPFRYLLSCPGPGQLPVPYPPAATALLAPALAGDTDPEVARFAAELRDACGGEVLGFLDRLTQALYRDWEVVVRETGPPHPAECTLAEGRGSCRDLAVLFMAACRSVGVAARFVSGYQEGDPDQDRRYLHAWAEVYLPGGGWRGYDPSHGLAVADRHVAVAASADPARAAPITGSFRGDVAPEHPVAEIEIRTAANPGGDPR